MNRNPALDSIKTLTIILVVIHHVCVFYAQLGVINFPSDPVLTWLTYFINAIAMPLFFFISGMIYGICVRNGKYANASVFVRKKIRRLLIPYWFWGLAIVSPVMCLLHFTDMGFLHYCVYGILLGHNNRHLWYLISLFSMFIITDCLRRLRIFKSHGRILLILLALMASLFYPHAPSIFNISSTMRCFIFFLSGIYAPLLPVWGSDLHAAAAHSRNKLKPAASTAVVFCFLFLLCWAYRHNFNPPWLRLAAGYAGIIMIFSVFSLIPKEKVIIRRKGMLLIQNNSFGIYLAHPMIIYIIMYIYNNMDISLPPLLIAIVVSTAAIILSVLVTVLIRKLHAPFLIGE